MEELLDCRAGSDDQTHDPAGEVCRVVVEREQ